MKRLLTLCAAVTVALAQQAHATAYNIEFTFDNGDTVSGMFEADLVGVAYTNLSNVMWTHTIGALSSTITLGDTTDVADDTGFLGGPTTALDYAGAWMDPQDGVAPLSDVSTPMTASDGLFFDVGTSGGGPTGDVFLWNDNTGNFPQNEIQAFSSIGTSRQTWDGMGLSITPKMITNGVPEGGSTLALLGAVVSGLMLRRRRN